MSPFVVYIAADLYNRKVNLELTFPSFPTLSELHQHTHSVFTAEVLAIRPAGAKQQIFGISKVQLYNDVSGNWADLTSSSMLQPYAQLYVFQTDPNYREAQEAIAPARKPACYQSPPRSGSRHQSPPRHVSPPRDTIGSSFAPSPIREVNGSASYFNTPMTQNRPRAPPNTPFGTYGSATRGREVSPNASAVTTLRNDTTPSRSGYVPLVAAAAPGSQIYFATNASHSDKSNIIFEHADKHHRRSLQESDLRALFKEVNIDFAPHVISGLFRQADTDRDGSISFTDFHTMLRDYPTVTDSIYFRLKDAQDADALQQKLAIESVELEEAKRRRDHCLSADEDAQRRINNQRERLNELDRTWTVRFQDEQDLGDRLSAAKMAQQKVHESMLEQQKELGESMSKEDNARRSLAECERESSYCRQQHQKAVGAKAGADARVKELMRQLEEAQAEAQLHGSHVAECESEIVRSEKRERDAANTLTHTHDELQRRKQSSDRVEGESLDQAEAYKQLLHRLEEQQSENEQLAATIEASNEDMRRLEKVRDNTKKEIALVEINISECERHVAAADQEIGVFAQRRAVIQAKERPLLEQEVRIKEQRLQLDATESELRREAYTVFDPQTRVTK